MTAGIVNVLKPPGLTSHDVVAFLRRIYGLKRVGHAGTLDPAAAGVLPVFLGTATRLIEYTADADKAYRTELTFGYATDSGDDTGVMIAEREGDPPARAAVEAALADFVGEIEQVPPMHSAIKVGGRKLYELARAGVTVERAARPVTISSISLIDMTGPVILFDVVCSKGTYIRSLCRDIGDRLGWPAVMSFLVRTRVGGFALSSAKTLEEIVAAPAAAVLPLELAVGHLPAVVLPADDRQSFLCGRLVTVSCEAPAGFRRVYDEAGSLLGIGRSPAGEGPLKPLKVLAANS
jgi:tRNA pseudouridine55 synthase